MNKLSFNKMLPHLVAVVLFLAISFVYFSPLLEGKKIQQSDVIQAQGMSKEINDFRAKTNGEEPLWTNSMFGGMPSYLITIVYPFNLMNKIYRVYCLFDIKPVCYLFSCLLGFYLALLIFGVNPWLSIVGAMAFSFSSYFFIIISVGHITKTIAITFMAPIIAGVYLAYKKKMWAGAIIAASFLAMQLITNHFQIVYYTFLTIGVFVLFQVYVTIREKSYLRFIKVSGVLLVAVIIAFGTSLPNLWLTYEYGKESMRGQSELTSDLHNKTSGLDKDYALAWSYGKMETLTLLVPNALGGASDGELSKSSETYNALRQNNIPNADKIIKQLPLYFGTQPFTSGPVYVGAIVFFLFIMGLFLVKGNIKWWLLSATIFSIILAWGKNFYFLSDLFLNYFPGYNKFRTVSMILVIAQFTMPLLGILAINRIIKGEISKEKFLKALKYSLIIAGGIALIFAVLPGMFFDFKANGDKQLTDAGWPDFLINALLSDREGLVRSDAFRSLIFILLSGGLLVAFYYKKIAVSLFYILLGVLILIDMWPIDRRYLNDKNFVTKTEEKTPFAPTDADLAILQDKDPDYRVLNLSVNTFNDASTSYFHKSIGGYHGAKMKRYQELIENHISKNNMEVLNMLNTKYFIIPTKDKGPVPQLNPNALGNAWFVHRFRFVANADSELNALSNFNPRTEAIIDKRFEGQITGLSPNYDSTASIKLTSYAPNHLVYNSKAKSEQLAIFSEIYYNDHKGWKAYIDGKPASHFRANYVLRAMKVPPGDHTIDFKFEPSAYYTGGKISFACSLTLILLLVGTLYFELFPRNKKIKEETAQIEPNS